MKRLSFGTCVFAAIFFSAIVYFKPPAQLDEDLWLNALMSDQAPQKNSQSTEEFIFKSYQHYASSNRPEWLHNFTAEISNFTKGSLRQGSDYIELANTLYRVRERVRLLEPLEKTRSGLHLLTSLTDETLYALSVRFPDEAKKRGEWRIDFAAETSCEIGKYFGFGICQGDVVLTKSEAFSSSLFSFRSSDSGTFSHASTPYFTKEMKSPLMIEAEPTGGLFEDSAKEDQPPKVGTYRLMKSRTDERDRISGALQAIVKSRGSQASFNFQLDPRCEAGRYFCTEIVYCAYLQSGLPSSRNPYAEGLWSPPTPQAQEFIGQISDTRKGPIPMPGDVELSPAFIPVGFATRLDQIPILRIHAAIVEAFIDLMHTDQELRRRYLKALGKFGEKKLGELEVGTDSLNFLDQLGLPGQNKLSILRAQLPPETRMKEIAFYFHFQNQMLSQISSELLAYSAKQSVRPIGMGELKKMATPELRRGTEAFIALLGPLERF